MCKQLILHILSVIMLTRSRIFMSPATVIPSQQNQAGMQDSLAVANYFLDLASESKKTLDQMKLQKLVYFAHGWHLATNGSPLINECVEAWEYGPVVPSIYHAFKQFGSGQITEKASRLEFIDPDSACFQFITPAIDEPRAKRLLKQIWETYGEFSAVQLSNMTHEADSPWSKTYATAHGRKGVDIPDSMIKEYFDAKLGANT